MKSKEYYNQKLNGRCYTCGKKISTDETTRDHVIPKSKGGSGKEENIMPACRQCNRAKDDMSLEEYRLIRFKDSPNPSKEKFYFEQVLDSHVEEESKERKRKAQSSIPEWRLTKMDKDPGYRAMLKVLGLLDIAQGDFRQAVGNYMSICCQWYLPVTNLEDDYQLIVFLADECGRVRNLLLNLVELRYGTRTMKSLGKPSLAGFNSEEILAEIDTLENSLDQRTNVVQT